MLQFEVEQKYVVQNAARLAARLEELGMQLAAPVAQSDLYFSHPSRDFARTDEALRIRTVGGQSWVTYKGPKIDHETKTRQELELPLADADSDGRRFAELLQRLGFRPVATVLKERRPFHARRRGHAIECALDAVAGVGTFVELEIPAEECGVAAAQAAIAELAKELELGPSERRSYLELLLGG